MLHRVVAAVAGLATVAGLVTGCSNRESGTQVVAAFYPLAYVAERIGGDAATVRDLTAAGAEPHDIELTGQQVGRIETADLVVYLHGFQPAVDEAAGSVPAAKRLDVATVQPLVQGYTAVEEGELSRDGAKADPHVWLDPVRLQRIVEAVAERMSDVDNSHADGYRQRAAALRAELARLDADYRAGLRTCARHDVVVSHNAFGYLSRRYGLRQVSLTGLTPDAEPSPRRLAEVATYARDHGVTTIFFESLVSPRTATSVASEIGVRTAVLDPVEGVSKTDDYLAVMRRNLATLRTALGCR